MLANDLFIDAFTRLKESVHSLLKEMNENDLYRMPNNKGNSIAWLIWHLTRGQDAQIADLAGTEQIWRSEWSKKFNLPFSESATGYGQSKDDVSAVKPSIENLLGYFDATYDNTLKYIKSLDNDDYDEIIDSNWNLPVTVAIRLVSILEDDIKHIGQAEYAHGLVK